MKIVIFGLPLSPNLGDGIISDCLRWGLLQGSPGVSVSAFDLSGREAFSTSESYLRLAALTFVDHLPQVATHAIAKNTLRPKIGRIAEEIWYPAIEAADAVVIGGGQLFADHALNFPIKIEAVAALCERLKKPMAAHAVGCARSFSPAGRSMLARCIESDRLVSLTVRDEQSRLNLLENFKPRPVVHVVRDPAFLVSRVYAEDLHGPTRGVGLGITHPSVLKAHGAGASSKAPLDLSAFYRDLSDAVEGQGGRPVLFTNGAFEDQRYLDSIANGGVESQPRPRSPKELVARLSRFERIAAHRLHACIVAYALGKPVVGFSWDSKMPAFFETVGRVADLFAVQSTDTIAAKAARRLFDSGPLETRHALAEETLEQIRRLAQSFV
jgi:polysaccharide pyruvyl transferase WcaK-like protein